jgi:PAS domain S-box-containing protein
MYLFCSFSSRLILQFARRWKQPGRFTPIVGPSRKKYGRPGDRAENEYRAMGAIMALYGALFGNPKLEKHADRIRVNQGVQLVRMMPFPIFGNWTIIALVVINAPRATIESYAWIPLAAEALLILPLFLTWWRLKDAPPPKSVSKRRIRSANIHSALLGLCWAATALLVFPHMTATEQIMHGAMMSVLVIGAAASISYVPLASLLYAGQILLSLLLGVILFDKTETYILVLSSAVLCGAFLFVQRLSWRNFLEYVEQSESYSALLAEQLETQQAAAGAQQQIIEAAPFALVLTRHDNPIFASQRAHELFGIPSAEAIRNRTHSNRGFFVNPVDYEALKQKQIAMEPYDEYEAQLYDTHGNRFWVQISGRPIQHQGEWCWVNAFVIIEERKRIESELAKAKELAERASHAKTDFLANMSHELRTPLNAIIGYSEILLGDATQSGATELADDLKKIRAAGRHILALINDILDLSKIEAGKMELLPEHVPLDDLLGDVAAVIRNLMAKNGNRFSIENAAAGRKLWTDVTKVRQIIINLLSNAGKFTSNGTVTLQARAFERDGADWLSVKVSDTGVGITPEKLGAVFNEYDRGDAGTARRYGGTGLGLSLSRKIARLLGGDITVTSTVGAGSSFEFTMPIRLEQADDSLSGVAS